MEQLPEANHIIELNLPRIMRQTLSVTGLAFVSLFTLQLAIHQAFSYTFTLLTFSLDIIIFFVGYFVLIILHEFFHLLGFRLFSKVPWRSMKVGMDLKQGIAYATTPQLMVNKDLRKSLLLPFWMTGVIPALIGLYLDSSLIILLAALLIGGAAGDFSMYRQLKRWPSHWLIKDHPTKPKLFVFSPERLAAEQSESN